MPRRSKKIGTLNAIERLIGKLPFYYWVQRFVDLPILTKWAGLKKNAAILEIGCGTGRLARYLSTTLRTKTYYAVDINPKVVAHAESLSDENTKIIYQVADACRLPFKDAQFDHIIVMDVLHQTSKWKTAIKEIRRVLKPKGKLVLRDYSIETFTLPGVGLILQRLFDHPYDDMYDQIELVTHLNKNGFTVTHQNDSSWMTMLVAAKDSVRS